jgi:hypothetical protein
MKVILARVGVVKAANRAILAATIDAGFQRFHPQSHFKFIRIDEYT